MRPSFVARLFIAALTGLPVAAAANIPDPDFSDVPNILTDPSGLSTTTITVNGAAGPVAGAVVEIRFGPEAEAAICWCTGQARPNVSAVTDLSGQAVFNIAAGGCIDTSLVASPPAVQVFVDGFLLAEPGVVSMDVVDDTGTTAQGGWSPGASCRVTASDAVWFTPHIVNATYAFCADIDSDAAVTASDAVLITPGIINSYSCTRAP